MQMQVMWGKQHKVVFVPSEKKLFVVRDDILIIAMPEKSTKQEREEFLKLSMKNELKKEIRKLMPKWESITGLKCFSWFIGKDKRAWGWCKPQIRRIMLNEGLVYKPKQCLEYVILHELCHIDVPNHGKKFGDLLDKYMPDWRTYEVLENGKFSDYGKN